MMLDYGTTQQNCTVTCPMKNFQNIRKWFLNLELESRVLLFVREQILLQNPATFQKSSETIQLIIKNILNRLRSRRATPTTKARNSVKTGQRAEIWLYMYIDLYLFDDPDYL